MILQARDRVILRFCYEQQFLLLEHVQRHFFKGSSEQNSVKRVLELERAGYIRRDATPTLDGKRLIRLTKLGLRSIAEDIAVEVPQSKRPDVRTLRHDAILTSVRLRLHELWSGSWLPERVLKHREFPQIPDGVFLFSSGKKVAVEVENSVKYRARLLAIFERWRQVDVKLLLYVATTEELFGHLKNCITVGPRTVPLALIRYRDLFSQNPVVWTPGGEVAVFNRKEY